MVNCPECTSPVKVPESPHVNEIIECQDCRIDLEVIGLEPLLVGLAPDVEEDWGE